MQLSALYLNRFKAMSFFFLCVMALASEFSVSLGGLSYSLFFLSGIPLIYASFMRENLNFSKSQIFLSLTILTLLLSTLYHFDSYQAPFKYMRKLRYLFFAVGGVFILRHLVQNYMTSEFKRFLPIKILFLSVNLAVIYALICRYLNWDFKHGVAMPNDGRLHSFTGSIGFSYELPIWCLCIWAMYLSREAFTKEFVKKWIIPTLILSTIGVLFSGTRGGVLAFILAFPFLFLFKYKKLFFTFMALSLVSVMTLLVLIQYQLVPSSRLLMKFNNISNRIRLAKIYSSIEAFKDKPIFGHGLLSMKEKYKTLSPRDVEDDPLYDTHNTYLQVLTDGGLVAFIPFIFFLFFWGREILMRRDLISKIVFASFIAFLIENLYHTQFVSGVNTAMNLCLLYMITQLPLIEEV